MEKLSQELRSVSDKEIVLDVGKHLRETAQKWSTYCCEELDSDLLTKGLMITKSLIDFVNEYEANP